MPMIASQPRAVWVRLKPDQFATLQALADREDRPPASLARRLLIEAMEQHTLKRTEVPMS